MRLHGRMRLRTLTVKRDGRGGEASGRLRVVSGAAAALSFCVTGVDLQAMLQQQLTTL